LNVAGTPGPAEKAGIHWNNRSESKREDQQRPDTNKTNDRAQNRNWPSGEGVKKREQQARMWGRKTA